MEDRFGIPKRINAIVLKARGTGKAVLVAQEANFGTVKLIAALALRALTGPGNPASVAAEVKFGILKPTRAIALRGTGMDKAV